MPGYDEQYNVIGHNLRKAFYVELFVQFCFLAAALAMTGVFAGGSPTSTPLFAKIYIVVAFFVTIVVIIRTRQMEAAARRGDLAALQRLNINAWTVVALLFSAMLPSVYLYAAAASMPRR